jgi:hypothetical protein
MSENQFSSLLDSLKEVTGDRSSTVDKMSTWMNSTVDRLNQTWKQTTGASRIYDEEEVSSSLLGSIRDSVNTAIRGDESGCFGLSLSQVNIGSTPIMACIYTISRSYSL